MQHRINTLNHKSKKREIVGTNVQNVRIGIAIKAIGQLATGTLKVKRAITIGIYKISRENSVRETSHKMNNNVSIKVNECNFIQYRMRE